MSTKTHNEPQNIDGNWTGTYLHRCGHASPFSIPVASHNKGDGRTIGHMRRIIRRERGMACPACRAKNNKD